jgi:hypothetical protein
MHLSKAQISEKTLLGCDHPGIEFLKKNTYPKGKTQSNRVAVSLLKGMRYRKLSMGYP